MFHHVKETLFEGKSYDIAEKFLLLYPKTIRDETKKRMDMPHALHDIAVRLVCIEPLVAGHPKGRAADGETGEAEQEAIQESQSRPLQASGEENQEDDQEGQATCRADAPPAKDESVFLIFGCVLINKV